MKEAIEKSYTYDCLWVEQEDTLGTTNDDIVDCSECDGSQREAKD